MCVGAIAGLATITPAAGFIRPWAAFLIGILAALFCYASCELKKKLKWDDALDVWGVHGMGGALGSILLGALADEEVGGVPASATFFGKQVLVVALCIVYSYLVTIALLKILDMATVLKPSKEDIQNLDKAFHGEEAYSPRSSPVCSSPAIHTTTVAPPIDLNLDAMEKGTPEKGTPAGVPATTSHKSLPDTKQAEQGIAPPLGTSEQVGTDATSSDNLMGMDSPAKLA